MVTEVGKSVAVLCLPDGSTVNIFNKQLPTIPTAGLHFTRPDGSEAYVINYDASYATARGAVFRRALGQNSVSENDVPLIYAPNDQNVCSILFQVMSPTIHQFDENKYQLSWWTNLENCDPETISSHTYLDYTVHKFDASNLDIENDSSNTKALCTAYIKFEKLKCSGGGTSSDGDAFQIYPIITRPIIVYAQKGQGFIVDFATGGGGGGIGVHAHTSVQDAGFAAAVFMPSAIMKPFNWK